MYFTTISISDHKGKVNKDGPCPIECEKSSDLVQKSRKRVEAMDATDECSVGEMHIDVGLRTAMSALEYGIQQKAWDGVADALIMIQQIEFTVRRGACQHMPEPNIN